MTTFRKWYRADADGKLVRPSEAEYPNLTGNGDLAELAVEHGALGVYDTALPQQWVMDVVALTGESPTRFVWSYPPKSVFGQPFPLTAEAAELLAKYERLVQG